MSNTSMPRNTQSFSAASKPSGSCRIAARELQALKYSEGFVADQQLTENRREKRKMEALMSRLYDKDIDGRKKRVSNESIEFAAKEADSLVMAGCSGSDAGEKPELSPYYEMKDESNFDDDLRFRPSISPLSASRATVQSVARIAKPERHMKFRSPRPNRHVSIFGQKRVNLSEKRSNKRPTKPKKRSSSVRTSRFGLCDRLAAEPTSTRSQVLNSHSPVRERVAVQSFYNLGEYLDAELNDDEVVDLEPVQADQSWSACFSNSMASFRSGSRATHRSRSLRMSARTTRDPMTGRYSIASSTKRDYNSSVNATRSSRVRKTNADASRKRSEAAFLQRESRTSLHEAGSSSTRNESRTELDERGRQRQIARFSCTLYEAVKASNLRAVRRTLHSVANANLEDASRVIDAVNMDGYSPLHRAVMNGSDCIVRELLQHGAQCDTVSRTGSTPLDEAVRRTSPSCVRLLILAGARRLTVPQIESPDVTLGDSRRNLAEFAQTLINTLTQAEESASSSEAEVSGKLSLAKQYQAVCSILRPNTTTVDSKPAKSEREATVAELQFSDVPFDDVVVIRERVSALNASDAGRFYVLADLMERRSPLDESFVKRHVAVATFDSHFELLAPFFDVERAASVRDALAQRSADFGTADELVDDEIANLAELNSALLQQLSIRTRSIPIAVAVPDAIGTGKKDESASPSQRNALADHDYVFMEMEMKQRNRKPAAASSVLIRETPQALCSSPNSRAAVKHVKRCAKPRPSRSSVSRRAAAFDSNANSTRPSLSLPDCGSTRLRRVDQRIFHAAIESIHGLDFSLDADRTDSIGSKRLAFDQRLSTAATVTVVENGVRTEKHGVLLFIPFAQQQDRCNETDGSPTVDAQSVTVERKTEDLVDGNITKEHVQPTEGLGADVSKPTVEREVDGTQNSSVRAACKKVDDKPVESRSAGHCAASGRKRVSVSTSASGLRRSTRAKRSDDSTVTTPITDTKANADKLVTNSNGGSNGKSLETVQCNTDDNHSADDRQVSSSICQVSDSASIWSGFDTANSLAGSQPAVTTSLNRNQDVTQQDDARTLDNNDTAASWCGDAESNLFALAQKWTF